MNDCWLTVMQERSSLEIQARFYFDLFYLIVVSKQVGIINHFKLASTKLRSCSHLLFFYSELVAIHFSCHIISFHVLGWRGKGCSGH